MSTTFHLVFLWFLFLCMKLIKITTLRYSAICNNPSMSCLMYYHLSKYNKCTFEVILNYLN